MATVSDDLQDEEDEAVRCLCDSEEYPGRPPVEGPDADIFAAIELTEDVTGFFVQCDICKVWQHGACVGIFSAESSPEEYFCELCRKDLHKIHTASNGYVQLVSLARSGDWNRGGGPTLQSFDGANCSHAQAKIFQVFSSISTITAQLAGHVYRQRTSSIAQERKGEEPASYLLFP